MKKVKVLIGLLTGRQSLHRNIHYFRLIVYLPHFWYTCVLIASLSFPACSTLSALLVLICLFLLSIYPSTHSLAGSGQSQDRPDHLKLAQQFFQLVGASSSECDTIPGRQCMASCFFLLHQFDDVLIYLNSIKASKYQSTSSNKREKLNRV